MEKSLNDHSGFCSLTGIYYSKWNSPILPSQTSSLSFPSFLLSKISPQFLQKPALIDSKTGNSIMYQDLRSLSIALSHSLHSLGVKKGDVILVLSLNSIYFPVLVLGIMSIGAIFTTSNPLNTRQELQSQIRDSNPVLVFTTHELHSKFDGDFVSRPIILIEEFFEKLVNYPKIPSSKLFEFTVDQDDTAALMYSSGTTGMSKGVVSTHRSFIAQSCMVRHVWDVDGNASNDMHMCVVPLFHMFGFSMFICGAVAVRSTVVVVRKYSVEEVTVGIEKYKVTRLPAVPPMVVQLMRLQGKKKHLLGGLKEVISAGAPLGKEHIECFNKVYPQVRLSQSYGLTEANGSVTLSNGVVLEGNGFDGSVGMLLPCVEARIINVETQQPLPPLTSGELCVRGPHIMKGYYKNQEATSLAIDKDGWFRTGDLCFIDKFGLVHIVDRIKELIKYNAYQVAPAELEEILSKHPEINDAAVTSYPDEVAGEIPMACVVRKGTSKVTEEEIIAFMANKVAPYKKIRKVVFVESIPRSASGKILRRKLKALFTVSHQQQQHLKISSNL